MKRARRNLGNFDGKPRLACELLGMDRRSTVPRRSEHPEAAAAHAMYLTFWSPFDVYRYNQNCRWDYDAIPGALANAQIQNCSLFPQPARRRPDQRSFH